MSLAKFQSQLNHCLHCHLCYAANWQKIDDWRILCPSAARFGFESFYSAGKIELARGFIEGKIKKATQRLLDVLYSCTGCGACREQCHELSGFTADHIDLFETMKAYVVSKGWGPLPKHREFSDSINKNHNPYNENHATRFDWFPQDTPSDTSLVYFVGCTSCYRQQKIAQATVNILSASQTPFTVLGSEEWCCGSPLIRTGQLDALDDIISHNIEAITSLGAETVVFSCAGCFKTFKEDYPKRGYSLPFKIRHTTQFFLDLIRDKKLQLNALPGDVTYHDPCHLGRHAGVYKQPRRILEALQMKVLEMPRNMEGALCCGAGSGVRAAYPEFSQWVCKERLDEAIEVGASILASACPFCKNNFEGTVKNYPDQNLRIVDISELIEEALK